MKILERAEDGLKRTYKVFVSPKKIEDALKVKLQEQASKMRVHGFRPGKVPVSMVQRMYGASLREAAVRDLISSLSKKIIADEKLAISFDFATSLVKDDAKGIEYLLKFELVPQMDLKDISKLELTRHIVEVSDKEVNSIFDDIRKNHKNWIEEPEKTKIREGHNVSVDLTAKMKVKNRHKSMTNSIDILVGDPHVLPDFWQPLIGKTVGDVVDFVVNYPKNMRDKNIAGKKVEYSGVVKKVSKSSEYELDDVFAKSLGYESFEKLHEWAKTRAAARYEQMSNDILKRDLLEKMSEMYDFDVPSNMFEIELGEVRRQIVEEARKLGIEMTKEAEEGCRKIAADRVRLGFVVAEIAKKEKISVSRKEIGNEINNIAALYPGHEKAVWDTYSRGAALNAVVGPLLERKVVDFLLGFIKVKDKKCTVQQLIEIDEEPFDFFKEAVDNHKKKTAGKKKESAKEEEHHHEGHEHAHHHEAAHHEHEHEHEHADHEGHSHEASHKHENHEHKSAEHHHEAAHHEHAHEHEHAEHTEHHEKKEHAHAEHAVKEHSAKAEEEKPAHKKGKKAEDKAEKKEEKAEKSKEKPASAKKSSSKKKA